MKTKEEMLLCEKLYASPYELGKVPSNISDDYLSYLVQNEKLKDTTLKNYKFRVVEVQNDIINEVSGEESGDESGDESGEANKEEQLAKTLETAGKLLDFVKEHLNDEAVEEALLDEIIEYSGESVSGDVFTQIATKVPATRYVLKGSSIDMKSNGDLDEVSSIYLDSDYGPNSTVATWGLASSTLLEGIVKFLPTSKAGEFSNVIQTDTGAAFIYVDSIDDTLNDSDMLRLNNDAAHYYIEVTANMTHNKSLVNRIKLDELMPIVARKAEEAANASGDIQ
jgi:hypothetical protein